MVIELARFSRPDTGSGQNLIAAPLLLEVVDAIEPSRARLGTEIAGRPRSDEVFVEEPMAELVSEV